MDVGLAVIVTDGGVGAATGLAVGVLVSPQ
jgi:hypothetical protein